MVVGYPYFWKHPYISCPVFRTSQFRAIFFQVPTEPLKNFMTPCLFELIFAAKTSPPNLSKDQQNKISLFCWSKNSFNKHWFRFEIRYCQFSPYDSYCWWTKSCTTKDDDDPIIYRILTIPGGAGFLPSTVVPPSCAARPQHHLRNVRGSVAGMMRVVKPYNDEQRM